MADDGKKAHTPVGRLAHPHFFKKKAFDTDAANGNPEGFFRCMLVFDDPKVLREMKLEAKRVMEAFWGEKVALKKEHPKFHNPFVSNAHKADKEGFTNAKGINIAFKSKELPKIRKAVRGADGKLLEALQSEVYPGCEGRVSYSCFAYEKGGGIGVAFWFNNFILTGRGKRISGAATDPDDDFADIEDSADLDEPLADEVDDTEYGDADDDDIF